MATEVLPLIRPFEPDDWPQLLAMLRATVQAADTIAFDPGSSHAALHAAWVAPAERVGVAVAADGAVLGSYMLKPNQPGLGAHVCNAGYVVAPAARGRGIAAAMCVDSQRAAQALGYRAMQFNLVVSTNTAAVHLWQRLGFAIVGTLPGAFHLRRERFVDAYVMWKALAG